MGRLSHFVVLGRLRPYSRAMVNIKANCEDGEYLLENRSENAVIEVKNKNAMIIIKNNGELSKELNEGDELGIIGGFKEILSDESNQFTLAMKEDKEMDLEGRLEQIMKILKFPDQLDRTQKTELMELIKEFSDIFAVNNQNSDPTRPVRPKGPGFKDGSGLP